MEILNKKQKILLALIGGIMILFIGYYIIQKTENYNYKELETFKDNNPIENSNNSNEEEIIDEEIVVHITGEVKNEGIIKTYKNARLSEVIEKAGGATETANLSEVNLAYSVKDGQKIYIPNIDEEELEGYITEEAGNNVIVETLEKEEKVNINTASQTELETLSGIGPSTALKIINYRKEKGEFKTIEDLKNVQGIGESKFESIKEDICVK